MKHLIRKGISISINILLLIYLLFVVPLTLFFCGQIGLDAVVAHQDVLRDSFVPIVLPFFGVICILVALSICLVPAALLEYINNRLFDTGKG